MISPNISMTVNMIITL